MEKSKGGASHALPTTSPGKFKCPLCPKRYVQQQGLNRHLQDKHEDGLKCHEEGCPHKWIRSREADYRKLHLGRKHGWGDEKISEKLGRSARRHRRKSDSESPPHFSPPPIKRRQSLAEPQQCPPMLALLSGEDANHAFTPLFPPVAHNPQFGHENSSELKHLAHTLAPSRLLSEEESALVYAHWKIRGNYFRFVLHTILCDIYDRLCSQIPVNPAAESTTTDAPPWLADNKPTWIPGILRPCQTNSVIRLAPHDCIFISL